jgi:hypothetical protein
LQAAQTKITDRCRKRALAANPASEQPGASATAARGSGSCIQNDILNHKTIQPGQPLFVRFVLR